MFGEKHTLAFTKLKGNDVVNIYWIKTANCYTPCITLSYTMTFVEKNVAQSEVFPFFAQFDMRVLSRPWIWITAHLNKIKALPVGEEKVFI